MAPLSGHWGDVIVATVDWACPERLKAAAKTVAEFVVEAARPDPPMAVRTLDEELLTGALIVDEGEVLAFIGVRRLVSSHRQHSHEEPLWPRDVTYSSS